jgi:hypothetical protein
MVVGEMVPDYKLCSQICFTTLRQNEQRVCL